MIPLLPHREMHETKRSNPRLPLPKWCLVLLGVPTFYMPLAFLTLAICVVAWMLIGRPEGFPPEWLRLVAGPSVYVAFAMWPIYAAWVALSKRLTLREKRLWLLVVVFLNMVGMPCFYVFMVRRYLGIEARPGPRDEAALDVFLARCGIGRDELSAGQVGVLRSYCRTYRLAKWLALPAAIIASLSIYSAVVFLPRQIIPTFSDLSPTRSIIVDTAKNTRTENAPDPETQRLHVQIVMLFGAAAGMLGMAGVFLLVATANLLRPNLDRMALMEFLKAGGQGERVTGSQGDRVSAQE